MPRDNNHSPIYLSIAAVLYRGDRKQVQHFRDCLLQSIHQLRKERCVARINVCIVDNAAYQDGDLYSHFFSRLPGVDSIRFIQPDNNLGYGRAHNLCMHQGSDYHLMLNPDVYLDENALVEGIDFLQNHPSTGMVTPYGLNQDNEPLFLSKRYPTVFDFLLRGFAPPWLRKACKKRLEKYEMHKEYSSGQPCSPIEIASGCCMLIRTALLHKLNGFNEEYFLYFEDFDLSVRLRKHAVITFLPAMKIIHDGGNAAKKGWWHIRKFIRSAGLFFSQHGWKIF